VNNKNPPNNSVDFFFTVILSGAKNLFLVTLRFFAPLGMTVLRIPIAGDKFGEKGRFGLLFTALGKK